MKQKLNSVTPKRANPPFPIKLRLVIASRLLPRFFKLLEQGFPVTTKAGCSIKDLLCQHLGIDEDYLDKRIQTLFLDGKPVDDVEQAYLQNDATLALSGAMPGLVGAVLRKGGALASMRNTISYDGDQSQNSLEEVRVKLKLFNLVLKDLGPIFLENGIRISNDRFKEFLSRNLEDLKTACYSVNMDDQKIEVNQLAEIDWKDSEVFLKVIAEKPSGKITAVV